MEIENTWKVSVWGVRGSIPVIRKDFLEYGGNTSCISADCGDRIVVFDAGSGLAELGNCLEQQGFRGKGKQVDILISHLHMDHLEGIFGFGLFHDPSARIRLYGDRETGFESCLNTLVGRPYWPLGLKNFAADIEIHEIGPGECLVLGGEGDLTLYTFRGNHPGGSLLYRLEAGDKSIVYALDHEMEEDGFSALSDFCRDGNLIICDASFSPEELKKYRGWGHSSWEQGIALRKASGAGRALMTHYSHKYTDEFLRRQEKLAGSADPACVFLREGMEIRI